MKFQYGEEIKKAINNFGLGETPREVIKAYGEVKKAAIIAQQEASDIYPKDFYEVLLEVIDEIISGEHDLHFPLSLFQGGAGTSLHMNVCEVIASLANSKHSGKFFADPLDHIAKYQSTNDTFSTVVTIVVYRKILDIEELVIGLQEYLITKESEYGEILITARTELQAGLPMKLGQVFGGWAGAIQRDRWRLHKLKERLRLISLGGTAVGTCFSAPRNYIFKAEKSLRQITGLPLCRSQNLVDEISNHDSLSEVASGFEILAGNIRKMANDLLLYTSSLTNEIIHPEVQYGSSIMPFKVNPVFLEYIKGLSLETEWECKKISSFVREGQLQLNVFLPFILSGFLNSSDWLKKSINTLINKFFFGMQLNKENIYMNLINSGAILNVLREYIDYSKLKSLIPIIKKENPKTINELIALVNTNLNIPIEDLKEWFTLNRLTEAN